MDANCAVPIAIPHSLKVMRVQLILADNIKQFLRHYFQASPPQQAEI